MTESVDHHRAVDDYVVELAARQDEATPAEETNHRVNERRFKVPGHEKYHAEPCCIYFFYVRVNKNGTLYVKHFFYPEGLPDKADNPGDAGDWSPIPYEADELRKRLHDLAIEARKTGDGEYEEFGSSFRRITFQRKAYIAIFIDETAWKLHCIDGKPSIIFLTEKKEGKTGAPNCSFFDSMELSVTMPIRDPTETGPTEDERPAIVFINHMKADDSGRDLGDFPDGPREERRPFKFQIVFRVAYADGGVGMTVIFDPDGDNLGPPIAPP